MIGLKIKRLGVVDMDEEGKVWIGELMSGKLYVLNYLVENMMEIDDILFMG